METVNFSRKEFEPLRQLAEDLGVTVEEAAAMAAKEGLDLMFRLPENPDSEVIDFEGLNRPRSKR